MISEFKIRKCEDMEVVKTLHKDIFPKDDWYESPRTVAWVVWNNKNPVGFCMLSETNQNFVFYSRAGVVQKCRGKGLQIRMIRVREKYARKNGYKTAITYTKLDNIQSSHNLQKVGYSLYSPEYHYAGRDVLYWIKPL